MIVNIRSQEPKPNTSSKGSKFPTPLSFSVISLLSLFEGPAATIFNVVGGPQSFYPSKEKHTLQCCVSKRQGASIDRSKSSRWRLIEKAKSNTTKLGLYLIEAKEKKKPSKQAEADRGETGEREESTTQIHSHDFLDQCLNILRSCKLLVAPYNSKISSHSFQEKWVVRTSVSPSGVSHQSRLSA